VSRKVNTNEDYWRLSSDYSKVDPAIAAKIGFNEAVILRTIYGMCRWKKENDGTEWFQGSRAYWIAKFSWISISTFRRIINKLQQAGLIDVRVDTDGGNHYRPVHENIKKLLKQVANEDVDEPTESVQNEPGVKGRSAQNEPGTRLNLNRGSVQNEPALLTLGSSNLSSDLSSYVAAAEATALQTVSQGENSRPDPTLTNKTADTWKAYAELYERRYNVQPARNAKVNAQLKQFCERVGYEDAPRIITFYLLQNDYWYVKQMHTLGIALSDAEKLVAGYRRGSLTTRKEADFIDKRSSTKSFIDSIVDAMYPEDTDSAQDGGTL
jgi:hypothetical protein